MSRYIEICLWFCAICGHVSANQRRLPPGAATVEDDCPLCKSRTIHSPVAIEAVGRSPRFVTRAS